MLDQISKAFWQVMMEYVVKIALGLALVIWVCALSLTFCFTSNHFITNFEKASFITRTGINLIRSIRHNCRIVWGIVLEIDPKLYPGISSYEITRLPDPKKALYKFNSFWGPTQRQGLHLLALNALELERTSLGIFLAAKDIYANIIIHQINWDEASRTPAQLE